MSSCLSGSGRTYGFDVDIVKPLSSSSASARSLHSSSTSSTLSETCNSSCTISIKKARGPRKRPNQALNEAAALLSTIYPNVFSAESTLKRPPKGRVLPLESFRSEVPEFLPPFPVLGDAAFLIRDPPTQEKLRRLQQPSAFRFELKPLSPSERYCTTSSNSLESPGSSSPVVLDDDFDTGSIIDEEVGESINSIFSSNLSMNADAGSNEEELSGHQTHVNRYLRSLIGLRTGGKYDFGFRLRYNRSMQQALRRRDEGEWWKTPTVPVEDTVPQFKPSAAPSLEKKKKKKKVVKNSAIGDIQPNVTDSSTVTGNATTGTAATTDGDNNKAPALGLKLNHEAVLKVWSGSSMFSDSPDPPESSADVLAKLADVDLFGEDAGAGGAREAIVQRYKEKRTSRLFSRKIRYQVRKANADRRPRMQGNGERLTGNVACSSEAGGHLSSRQSRKRSGHEMMPKEEDAFG